MNIPGYQIERELGHGGMSTVYLAVQESLGREVALKVMAPALAADRSFGERFLHEGRTVAHLTHPNILAVYDIGSVEHSYYLAMEYVPGGDLKQLIKQGALPPDRALAILKQVAAALGYAHEKGFVHRDVKPENILFREDGTAVLTDFGIAKAVGSGSKMTGTGMTIGTAQYMSPEQTQGKPVDGRADLYSLGVVLYEMLVGQVPYDADSTVAIAIQHVQGPLPELPASLSGYQPFLNRMLFKDPDGRFSTAGELIAAIDLLLNEKPLEMAAGATRIMPQVPDLTPASTTGRGNGLKWAIGGVLLALLVFGAMLLKQQSRSGISSGRSAHAPIDAPHYQGQEVNPLQTKPDNLQQSDTGLQPIQENLDRSGQEPQEQSEKVLVRGNSVVEPITGIEFVRVPGGCFPMGSPESEAGKDSDQSPVHKVCVDDFFIGKTEVTQGQWRKIMGSNPSRFTKGDTYPVETVSWNDAQLFIRKLGAAGSKRFRLPTEAEWEFAARSGGKDEKYAGGNDVDEVAWYEANSGGTTHPVAQKRPNGLGLYDMSGNVWEWCSDIYSSSYYDYSPRNNPQGAAEGLLHVDRGGGWTLGDKYSRTTIRSKLKPEFRSINLGFRLVLLRD